MKTNYTSREDMINLKKNMTNENVKIMRAIQTIINNKAKELNNDRERNWDNDKIFEAKVYFMNEDVCYINLAIGKFEKCHFTVKITMDGYEYIQGNSNNTLISDDILTYFILERVKIIMEYIHTY